jgi:hypothetical protein
MSRYRCHVRGRNGPTQTELDIHDGEPPRVGTVINVVVAGKTVPVRICALSIDPSKVEDDPIIHVYMEEIN